MENSLLGFNANKNDLTEVQVVSSVITTLAAGLVGLSLADFFMAAGRYLPVTTKTHLLFLNFGHLVFVPMMALIGITARPLGAKGILVFIGSFALAYSMQTQFRGLWIWAGTFDEFAHSPKGWLNAEVVGLAIGLFLLIIPGSFYRKPIRVVISLYSLLACCILEVIADRVWSPESWFVGTRIFGLTCTLFVLSGAWFYTARER